MADANDSVTFESREIQDFLANLTRKTKAIADMRKEYAALLSAIVYRDIMDHFANEEGSGGPWKGWSKSYSDAVDGKVAFRTINGKVMAFDNSSGNFKKPRERGMILQNTGKLRNSFTPTKYKADGQGIRWYNNAKTSSGFPYAYAHDTGGPKLPKRDFMWLSDKAFDRIVEQTLQFMMENGF